MYPPINSIHILCSKNFQMVSMSWQFFKELLGKSTSPVLNPDPDLAAKIPDPAKGSGSLTLPSLMPHSCPPDSLTPLAHFCKKWYNEEDYFNFPKLRKRNFGCFNKIKLMKRAIKNLACFVLSWNKNSDFFQKPYFKVPTVGYGVSVVEFGEKRRR